MTVPAGHSLAIVGETGSGKTTLSYLIPRLYDVTSGSVTIDGTDVRDMSFDALAGAVGVVAQETYLFHASVADNLRFAKPAATDDELVAAAKVAHIHDHLQSLPDGYDTVVGERGYRFSGGEKQRLAIARAVLRDPPVLVLDEATSALDTQTEQAVQQAIDAASAGRTTITIAHRLSTIRDADEIIVLDRGEIAERGSHAELLARGGRYAALVNRDADLAEADLDQPRAAPPAMAAASGYWGRSRRPARGGAGRPRPTPGTSRLPHEETAARGRRQGRARRPLPTARAHGPATTGGP